MKGRESMRGQKGFSLIELLIVASIIVIIAAIAVPNFLRARISANESSAIAGTRTLATAETLYHASYSVGYAPVIANLGGASCASPSPLAACLIDQRLASATTPGSAKDGYIYGVSGDENEFSVGSYPASVGLTGVKSFCASADGVLHSDETGANNNSSCGSGSLQSLMR